MTDLLSVSGEDLPSEGRATVFRNANNMAQAFFGFRRKSSVNRLVVDLLPEMEPEEGANIHSHTSELVERNALDRGIVGVVE